MEEGQKDITLPNSVCIPSLLSQAVFAGWDACMAGSLEAGNTTTRKKKGTLRTTMTQG